MRNPREVIDDVAMNIAIKVVDLYLPSPLKTPKTKQTSKRKDSAISFAEVYSPTTFSTSTRKSQAVAAVRETSNAN